MDKAKWHACPRTTLKYKSSAEHLSGPCIWSFLPLSSFQLTTGCWKVLSAISLSVITTVVLCSDPGLSWRARGHVPFHNAASSLRGTLLFHKGWCFEVIFWLFFFFFQKGSEWQERLSKQKGRVTSDRGAKFWSRELTVHLNRFQKSLAPWM